MLKRWRITDPNLGLNRAEACTPYRTVAVRTRTYKNKTDSMFSFEHTAVDCMLWFSKHRKVRCTDIGLVWCLHPSKKCHPLECLCRGHSIPTLMHQSCPCKQCHKHYANHTIHPRHLNGAIGSQGACWSCAGADLCRDGYATQSNICGQAARRGDQ